MSGAEQQQGAIAVLAKRRRDGKEAAAAAEEPLSALADDVLLQILGRLEGDPRDWARASCASPRLAALLRAACFPRTGRPPRGPPSTRCPSAAPASSAPGSSSSPPTTSASSSTSAPTSPSPPPPPPPPHPSSPRPPPPSSRPRPPRRLSRDPATTHWPPRTPPRGPSTMTCTWTRPTTAPRRRSPPPPRRPQRKRRRDPWAGAPVAGARGCAPGVGVLDAEPRAGQQAAGQPVPRRPAVHLRVARVRARRGAAQVHGVPRRVPGLRALRDTRRPTVAVDCAFCGCTGAWDLYSAFCLRSFYGYHDDGEPVVRAYVCENGHVAGAWTERPLYA